MTESDIKVSNQQTRKNLLKGWTQGIFKIQVIAGLSKGDKKDTGTMIPAVHDIGLHAGERAKEALRGHGYHVREIIVTQLVAELKPGQSGQIPVGTLDQYDDGTLVYTTEKTPLIQAQKTAAISKPSQTLTTPAEAREFEVQVFTGKTFDEVAQNLIGQEDQDLAA
jgi:hypothetical protein